MYDYGMAKNNSIEKTDTVDDVDGSETETIETIETVEEKADSGEIKIDLSKVTTHKCTGACRAGVRTWVNGKIVE